MRGQWAGKNMRWAGVRYRPAAPRDYMPPHGGFQQRMSPPLIESETTP